MGIPGFITQFVNVDAKTFSFLRDILPEDNPALEFCSYLTHCQCSKVKEFSISLI
jgi:hypothetical protein